MKWSKLKQRVEALFAASVRPHAALHITRYGPGLSSIMTRAWLTWDGQELVNFSTIDFLHTAYSLAQSQDGTYDQIEAQLQQQGRHTRFDVTDALEAYLTLPIDQALSSSNPLIGAVAFLDRRVGRRRLEQVNLQENEHPFVKQLFLLRCKAEGFTPAATRKE